MTTTSAARLRSTYTGKGRQTLLDVDFVSQDGEIHTVTGPMMGPRLTTSTRPRPAGRLHDVTTAQGRTVCQMVDLEFWAVADGGPRRYWATRGGAFFLVHNVIQRAIITATPVDAWGTATGETVEHPAKVAQ